MRKIKWGAMALVLVTITIVNLKKITTPATHDFTLSALAGWQEDVEEAAKQAGVEVSYEDNSGNHQLRDMNWEDVESALLGANRVLFGHLVHDAALRSGSNSAISAVHYLLDTYDISGDPVEDYYTDSHGNERYGVVDQCNGQPNAC